MQSTHPQVEGAAGNPIKYVLDTNVLLHDPTALFRFEEHDIYLPLVVLEELDRHKKGVADIARHARQVTRTLDDLLQHGSMAKGFELATASGGRATGKLYFRRSSDLGGKCSSEGEGLERGKADNQILACARDLLHDKGNAVLVTKDINLRVKALALDVPAQDYRSDRVLSDEDVLPAGFMEINDSFWDEHSDGDQSFRRGGKQHMRTTQRLPVNSFLVERTARGRTRLWRVGSNTEAGSELILLQNQSPVDGTPLLTARNEEQQMALSLLHDEEVDVVALLGKAGSGKTLLALAAGLEQVKRERFDGVIITRATVPLGEEIGFLPGTEEEKMGPWLGGTLRDCFTALQMDDEKNPLRQKVEVSSMSFMRGRSFQKKFIIIDEAQNLTVKQVRALLTRAGEGSKVVLTGNLAQIDTPYLDEGSSGLAWAAKNLQDWPHAGHIILPRGVRSRLAAFVEEISATENQPA